MEKTDFNKEDSIINQIIRVDLNNSTRLRNIKRTESWYYTGVPSKNFRQAVAIKIISQKASSILDEIDGR